MSAAEILIRLILAVICWLAGTSLVLSVAAERRGRVFAVLLLVTATTAITVSVGLGGGGDRG